MTCSRHQLPPHQQPHRQPHHHHLVTSSHHHSSHTTTSIHHVGAARYSSSLVHAILRRHESLVAALLPASVALRAAHQQYYRDACARARVRSTRPDAASTCAQEACECVLFVCLFVCLLVCFIFHLWSIYDVFISLIAIITSHLPDEMMDSFK